MTLHVSAALRNAVNKQASMSHLMSNCVLKIYSGAQPASAEAAPTGSLLVTLSDNKGALTREVLSLGSVDLTGGGAGSVDTITVNSIAILPASVPFNTSLAQTAQDVCDAINHNSKNHLYTAFVTSTDIINIRAKPGMGTLPNGWVVASTVTTITKTDANMAGGVNPVNGLLWGYSAAGVLVKKPGQIWKGTPGATGTAGWFRFEASVSDAGGVDSTESIFRIDGTIATSGAELNMPSTSIVSGVDQELASYSLTLPTA